MNIIEARAAFYAGKPREQRLTVARVQMREADNGAVRFGGYASTTDDPYTVSDWLGDYTETIERGAFAKSLQEQDDVRLLLNHDGVPLARTKSGTLALREITDPLTDPEGRGLTGLWAEAELDAASPLVQTIRSAMDRGDLDQMSFAFRATRQEWDEDYTMRTIREVQLFDVSVVTYPANPGTTAGLRSDEKWQGLLDRAKRSLDPEDLNMLTQALGWFAAVDSIVDDAQASLAGYMGVANPDADDDAARAVVNPFVAKAAALRTRAA